jgi:multidrug resistance efflux pump
LWQSELEMARLQLQPSIAEENAVAFERLRLELLRLESEVASTDVDLQLAENQVRRQTALHEQKLLSDDLYDLSVKTRDSLRAELAAKSKAVAQIQGRIAALRPMAEPPATDTPERTEEVLANLAARQMAIATNWGPLTLLAPVTGMVTAVHRQTGEHLVDGEPVATISSLQSDRVVGYLRQPFPSLPEPGMTALLTTRAWKRTRYIGTVSQIGAQLEYITNSLAVIRTGTIVDAGLPVVINLPPHAQLRPGEIVDVEIQNGSRPPAGFGAGARRNESEQQTL